MGMRKAALTRTAQMSETTVMKNTAPRLQRVPSMKSIVVGLLAVFTLSGCGVGMDEPEGEQAAAGVSKVELMSASGDNSTTAQGEMRGPLNGDPRVGLPQDPIPVYVGNPAGPAGPRGPK